MVVFFRYKSHKYVGKLTLFLGAGWSASQEHGQGPGGSLDLTGQVGGHEHPNVCNPGHQLFLSP